MFNKIHKKATVAESLFSKKRLWRRCFPVNFVKYSRTPFLQNNSGRQNRNDKSACVNIFSELLLTTKFQHYLRMNATSYFWSYTDFYTLITYTCYITYTYNYTACTDYSTSSYIDFYNSLQYTFFIFTNNFFSILQLKQ